MVDWRLFFAFIARTIAAAASSQVTPSPAGRGLYSSLTIWTAASKARFRLSSFVDRSSRRPSRPRKYTK